MTSIMLHRRACFQIVAQTRVVAGDNGEASQCQRNALNEYEISPKTKKMEYMRNCFEP